MKMKKKTPKKSKKMKPEDDMAQMSGGFPAQASAMAGAGAGMKKGGLVKAPSKKK
jgi:hypothetical protein